MNRPKTKPTPKDGGPMLTTMLTVAAEQLADMAITRAANMVDTTLACLGFSDETIELADSMPGWALMAEQLEKLIRDAWAFDAARIERHMREEGVDPEAAAGLKVPHGVVPS